MMVIKTLAEILFMLDEDASMQDIESEIMNYFDEATTAHGTLEIFTAMEKELEKYYLAKEKLEKEKEQEKDNG